MVDVEARRPSAEFPFGEWYMRRARQYADIELDGADTELQDHIKTFFRDYCG